MKHTKSSKAKYPFLLLAFALVLAHGYILPGGTLVNAAGPYDGEWSGTTNQGYDMGFTVTDSRITRWTCTMEIEGSVCTSTRGGTVGFDPGYLISDNSFFFTVEPDPFGEDYDQYTGTFTAPAQCNGTWEAYSEHCNGTGTGTWTASKLVPHLAPDIKANGSDTAITVSHGSSVSIEVALESGDKLGQPADWWVVTNGPAGWDYYDILGGFWSFLPGISVTYQGSLFNLSSIELLDTSELSVGRHVFYFGVDMNMNASIDFDQVFYDFVEVNVTQ
ncbi:MAG: hypothetical protein K9N21_19965 [Deltaproteobacteria bacterium]|nr:hypothetical protein [Deltaproteobacteria bacterium]